MADGYSHVHDYMWKTQRASGFSRLRRAINPAPQRRKCAALGLWQQAVNVSRHGTAVQCPVFARKTAGASAALIC